MIAERNLERMRDYLDGRILPDDLAELNELLAHDSAARARFRSLATIEEGLLDLAAIPEFENAKDGTLPAISVPRNVFFRPFAAAAAGLMIGVFCTSAIWAATEPGRQKILTLLHESFESDPPPRVTGVPVKPDIWSGDYSEVASGFERIRPIDGNRMFRFLRADHQGKEKPVGYIGDLYRVVDLRDHAAALEEGNAVVSVESAFSSRPFEEANRFCCGISVYALHDLAPGSGEGAVRQFLQRQWDAILSAEGNPENLAEVSVAATHRRLWLSPGGGDWQKIKTELRLPGDSRFLMIRLNVTDLKAGRLNQEPPAVEFAGQFADDVKVTLTF